jgi:hypothetical protein
MREIELHSRKYPGLVALVDDDDYEVVSLYRWNPSKSRNTFYAATNILKDDGRRSSLLMHRLITGYPQTDHKDWNGLNNQRSNLRPATGTQNNANQRKRSNNSSGFKGVTWDTEQSKWYASIWVNYKRINLGRFASKVDAAIAYDVAARKYHGEYARTNFGTRPDYVLAA